MLILETTYNYSSWQKMREGQNECYGNRLIRSVPERSGWGGAAGHRNIDPVHMVPAEREKGSKIERDKQTLRPKQIGHLCLKYKNNYIIEKKQ